MTKEQQGVVLFLGLIMLAYFVWDSTLLFPPPTLEKTNGDHLNKISSEIIFKSPGGSKVVEKQNFDWERQGREVVEGSNLHMFDEVNQSGSISAGSITLSKIPALFMPIDINKANLEELSTLPGIGPKTAQAILAFRNEHGPFKSVEDLLQVRGLGPKKLAAIRERITVQ